MVTDFDSKISLLSVDDNGGDWTDAVVCGDKGDGPKSKLQEQNSALFSILSYVFKIQKCNSR